MRQTIQALDLRSAKFKQYPEHTWRKLHAQGAVITSRQPLLGRIAFSTQFNESQEVLRNADIFTVDGRRCGHPQAAGMRWWVPSVFKPLASNLLTLEGQEHRKIRKTADFAFRRSNLKSMDTFISAIAEECIHSLYQTIGKQSSADFVSAVARPLPVLVISSVLGFDQNLSSSNSPFNRALSRLGSIRGPIDLFRCIPAIRLISRTLQLEITKRRNEPRDDLLSHLIREYADTESLKDDELISLIFMLYVAGHETTAHLLSGTLLTIMRDHDIADQITHPLDSRSINEFLRLLSPVQMSKPRFVLNDMEFGGATLLRGETISALVGAANQDAQVYEQPDKFNPSRRFGKHLGFGDGPHLCMGLHLAILETSTVLNHLLFDNPKLKLSSHKDSHLWSHQLGLRALKHLHVQLE